MNPEPLIIALAPAELVLLASDGRLARRRLAADESAATALQELWTAEFPEDGTGWVLTVDDDPAALRHLCAAARHAGGRIIGAWRWDAEPLSAPNDSDLVARLSVAAAAARAAPSLLARKAWTAPALSLTGRRRWAAIAVGALILLGAAWLHLESNARQARRSAAAEAAHELEEAQAAAGLRRRETEQETERELSALAPPSAALHEALLALSTVAGPSVVVDQVTSRDLVVRVSYRRVPGAPGADDAIQFPSLVRETLTSQGVECHFETETTNAANGASLASEPSGPTFGLCLTARPRTFASDVAAAVSRLPTDADFTALHRTWANAWTLEDSSDAPVCAGVCARHVHFAIRSRGRTAWQNLLALTAAVERVPGAAVDQLSAFGDGSETGAFARVSLTATFLLRGS